MHCLFSPTALDHDLSYVDKTYYQQQQQQQPSLLTQGDIKSSAAAITSQSDKQQSTVQSIVLNKTIGLVTSVSRLDL